MMELTDKSDLLHLSDLFLERVELGIDLHDFIACCRRG